MTQNSEMPMPLQNRVTPTGDIVATSQRGLFTGNRGIIHDPATKTLLKRRWTSKLWIVCVCEFRERHREVMARRSWTELFFLDEATAFAAGHRPFFECRREDANKFRAAWEKGNRAAHVSACEIDAVLHIERLDGKAKRLHKLPMSPTSMPDGVMLADAEHCYLMVRGKALRWSFSGYEPAPLPSGELLMLTPPSTLRGLSAGYRPVLHPSALA
jgi:hypothetical protein